MLVTVPESSDGCTTWYVNTVMINASLQGRNIDVTGKITICTARNGPVCAGITYRNFFYSIFLKVYPCFPAEGMDVCLLCLYVVLSRTGRGLWDGLITRPEERYRVSVCVWSRHPEKGGQRSIFDYMRLWMNEYPGFAFKNYTGILNFHFKHW
jgi:hypothetical protein